MGEVYALVLKNLHTGWKWVDGCFDDRHDAIMAMKHTIIAMEESGRHEKFVQWKSGWRNTESYVYVVKVSLVKVTT